MKGLRHEVWEDPEGLTMLCKTKDLGDEKWLRPEKGSKLLHTFYASSHFEAMTLYYHFMKWGVYTTQYEVDKELYDGLL